jgi:hypothetical protein
VPLDRVPLPLTEANLRGIGPGHGVYVLWKLDLPVFVGASVEEENGIAGAIQSALLHSSEARGATHFTFVFTAAAQKHASNLVHQLERTGRTVAHDQGNHASD